MTISLYEEFEVKTSGQKNPPVDPTPDRQTGDEAAGASPTTIEIEITRSDCPELSKKPETILKAGER